MLKKRYWPTPLVCLFSPANADGIEIAAVDFDRETLKSLGVDLIYRIIFPVQPVFCQVNIH